LVGTPPLRGYMHGFFMDIQLYNRVRAVANPFEYEEYRKKKLKERMEAKRASRIAPKETARAKTSVNPEFSERLQGKVDNTKAGKVAKQVLSDRPFRWPVDQPRL
jgi:ribosome biogenesis protein ENP2